jgi:hypothetical protein
MQELLSRFSYQSSKLTWEIWLIVFILWCVVVACTISSIRAQAISEERRVFWTIMVSAIPVFGLMAYLPFSVRREELPAPFQLRSEAKARRKKDSKALPDVGRKSDRSRST